MKLARVTGKVWATIKDEKLEGIPLYIIQPLDENRIPFGRELVALDTVGSIENDIVYWVGGAEATFAVKERKVPSDVSIVGLVDRVDAEGDESR